MRPYDTPFVGRAKDETGVVFVVLYGSIVVQCSENRVMDDDIMPHLGNTVELHEKMDG